MPRKKVAAAAHHHHHEPLAVETQRERDYDTGTMRRRLPVFTHGPTLTEQHHKPDVDINNIMIRYMKTGTLDHVRQYQGQYGETPPGDYHDSLNLINEANGMFADLPSQLRRHFANNATRFLEFCEQTPNPGQELARISESLRQEALGIAPTAGETGEAENSVQGERQSGADGSDA